MGMKQELTKKSDVTVEGNHSDGEVTAVEKSKTKRFATKLKENVALISLFGLVLIITIVLIILVVHGKSYTHETKIETKIEKQIEYKYKDIAQNETTCTSDVCAEAATFLFHRINPEIDPCEDFYDHACGRFEETVYIRNPGTSTLSNIEDMLENIFHKIMESNITKTKSEKVLKQIYKKCLISESSKHGEREVLEDIAKIGKWPLADSSWKKSDFDLNTFLINLAKSGLTEFGIFKIWFLPASSASSKSRVYILAEEELPKIPHKINEVFSHLIKSKKTKNTRRKRKNDDDYDDDDDDDNDDDDDDDDDPVDQLANLHEELRDDIDSCEKNEKNIELNLADLEKIVPRVKWRGFLNSLIPKKNSGKVDLDSKVIVYPSTYFERYLPGILNKTKPEVLANYLITRYVMRKLLYMPTGISKFKKSKNREYECRKQLFKVLPLNFGMAFAYRYIDYDNIDKASKMTEDIRKEFIEVLKENKWMDEESKKKSIQKIERMSKSIGYPEQFNDTKHFEKRYETLIIVETDSYFKMMSYVLKWKAGTDGLDIAEENAVSFKEVYIVNAFYNRQDNTLKIASPFVRMPLYDSDAPEYHNYGVLGTVIGHEMGHGFDANGIQWNANMVEEPIFTNKTMEKFEKIRKCFIDSYSSFKYPGFENEQINGNASETENMADYIGAQLLYRLAKKLDNPQKLPGFQNINHMKMFFYSLASKSCINRMDPGEFENQNNEVHGFNRFRVNGVVSNFDGFSEVFKCKKGSPMNPVKKCSLY